MICPEHGAGNLACNDWKGGDGDWTADATMTGKTQEMGNLRFSDFVTGWVSCLKSSMSNT